MPMVTMVFGELRTNQECSCHSTIGIKVIIVLQNSKSQADLFKQYKIEKKNSLFIFVRRKKDSSIFWPDRKGG